MKESQHIRNTIALFDTKSHDREYFSLANKEYQYGITYFEPRLTLETAVLAEHHKVACLFVHDRVDKEIATHLKKAGVELLALRSNGYNHIDIRSVSELGMRVVRVPKYSPYAIAEYTIGLMLSLNRKIHQAFWRTKTNNFSLQGLRGFDMRNKVCGIIGAGQIGAIVTRLASAFEMKCIVYDPFLSHASKVELQVATNCTFVSSLDELFKSSDIITLHCQLTPENKYIINKKTLSMMKPGVHIINTSRGGLIETEALVEHLKNGHVGACALDVYEEEDRFFFEDFSSTFIDDDTLARLLTFPNVIISSHQAFFTHEALLDIASTTMSNIHSFFTHSAPGLLPNEVVS